MGLNKKNSSCWVNVSFQSFEENRRARHFSYNFLTKNKGNLINFTVNLIDSRKFNLSTVKKKFKK